MKFARFLAVFAMIHGAVFVGAGNAVDHSIHQDSQTTADIHSQHQHDHQHHEKPAAPAAGSVKSLDDQISCIFCLDGVAATGWQEIPNEPLLSPRITFNPAFSSGIILKPCIAHPGRSPPFAVASLKKNLLRS